MRRCASQWTRSCLGQAAPGFATCLSHAGEKSSFATFRKSWNSRSERRARSASNWGVQSNVKLCRPLLLPDLVHGRQEIVDVASNGEPRCRDVFVHRQFARLPALRPEPCLVGRHGNVGAQFNHSGTGYHFDLHSGFIEPVLTAVSLGRVRFPLLCTVRKRLVTRPMLAAFPYFCNSVIRQYGHSKFNFTCKKRGLLSPVQAAPRTGFQRPSVEGQPSVIV